MRFTRTEMIVCIVCVSVLALIAIPALMRQRSSAQMLRLLGNGRLIYGSLMPNYTTDWVDHGKQLRQWEADAFPSSSATSRFPTSTRYFAEVKQDTVHFSLFAAPGIPPYKGTNPAEFGSANNAWCVTLDIVPRSKTVYPFYFTRNLMCTSIEAASIEDTAPFGRKGVVTIMSDGAGLIIRGEHLRTAFNPSKGTNRVLRP